MNLTGFKPRFFLHLLLWTSSFSILMAQTAGTGAMAGMVLDESGLAIGGANVTAANTETGLTRTTATDSSGSYGFTMLPPGKYRVRFSAPGFKTAEILSVTVDVNNTPNVRVQMEAGAQGEEVIMQWEAQAVKTEASASGNLADEREVTSLPLSSRNYTQILGLSAGVSSEVNNASAIGTGSQTVQAAGGRASGFSMDGASSSNASATASTPNPDAIQQFSVQTSLYDAGSGRSSGATVNVVTKSGTNSFHGTFFEFVRNDIFNANEFFRKRNDMPRPVLKQNQFGFTFGGPIVKDRLFFFGSYQGTRQRNGFASAGFASNVTLPPLPETRTAATVGGAFCPEAHPGDKRYQTFFGGVQVACDGSNVSPVALNVLNLKLPGGSYYVLGSGAGTFQVKPFSIPAKYREDQILINVDYAISPKHTFAERLFYSNAPQLSNFSGGNSMPGAPSETSTESLNAQLKLTSILGTNFVNEARMSMQRMITISTPLIPFTNEDIGVPSLVAQINKLDSIGISGLFTIGATQSWDSSTNNRYIFADQISWVHGRQTIRAGIEIERAQWNSLRAGYAIGKMTFMSFSDFLLGLPGCSPGSATCNAANPIVDGVKTNGTAFSNVFAADGVVSEPDGVYHAYRLTNAGSFIQDDVKLTQRLTLNLGVRWEYNGLPYDKNGDHTTVWLSLIQKELIPPPEGTYAGFVVPSNFRRAMVPGVYRNQLNIPTAVSPSMTNFSPRFGFAWQPFGGSRFSVRGGYGFFYDRPNDTSVTALTIRSVPYVTPLGASGAANYFSSF
ncbi:MAG: carboxypeptidase regulatory-like protein, partial [Acidobacteria bacterium]|nr:carboxypeptidase regulatory-like protein [Acidobacteriota bacterium]